MAVGRRIVCGSEAGAEQGDANREMVLAAWRERASEEALRRVQQASSTAFDSGDGGLPCGVDWCRAMRVMWARVAGQCSRRGSGWWLWAVVCAESVCKQVTAERRRPWAEGGWHGQTGQRWQSGRGQSGRAWADSWGFLLHKPSD